MSTPYLQLDLPVVTSTLGPEWAELLNAALELIDDHDHTVGKGRPITSAALNINDDVSINSHNLTAARSYNMADQGSAISDATDVRSVYAVNGELYYNDSVGNQVQLTLNGAINASSIGGIGGDYATSTASVTYNSTSKTFFFYQNTSQSAKLDVGDLIIHETVASSNGVTLKSPSSLASAYTVTLPAALPASTLALQMSNTGVLTADTIKTAQIDPAGLGSAAYAAGSVVTASIADDNITAAKIDPNAGLLKYSKQVFNSAAGTYPMLIPTGVDRLIVRACGGGGGGGGGNSGGGNFGGGGGAGAQVRTVLVPVTASVSKTFNPSDVNTSTEFITLNSHGYAANQSVVFSTTGGLPGGLSVNTVYYIKAPTTNTFQVSTTVSGSAVNLTTQGTGVHTVTTCLVVVIGAGGTAGAGNNSNGGDGGETYLASGSTKLCRFPGGAHGIAATVGNVAGIGGTNFIWENQSTPGGNDSTAGSNPVGASGIGGTAAGSGGGGGGAVGNGGNGGVTGTSTNATNGSFGGGGGGGGGSTGTQCGAGGFGYLEAIYYENVNP